MGVVPRITRLAAASCTHRLPELGAIRLAQSLDLILAGYLGADTKAFRRLIDSQAEPAVGFAFADFACRFGAGGLQPEAGLRDIFTLSGRKIARARLRGMPSDFSVIGNNPRVTKTRSSIQLHDSA